MGPSRRDKNRLSEPDLFHGEGLVHEQTALRERPPDAGDQRAVKITEDQDGPESMPRKRITALLLQINMPDFDLGIQFGCQFHGQPVIMTLALQCRLWHCELKKKLFERRVWKI